MFLVIKRISLKDFARQATPLVLKILLDSSYLGSVFATPFIESGIQGYNAYKALQDARKNANVV